MPCWRSAAASICRTGCTRGRDQVRAAYPRLDAFIAKKRHYDPQLRFRNLMWDKYFA